MKIALFYAVTFFFSVLHELSHALAARLLGCSVSVGTAGIFGNVMRIESGSSATAARVIIQMAGPAFNIIAAMACYAILCFEIFGKEGKAVELARMSVLSNIMLAAFNLLPFFPLDGGRVVASILAYFATERTSEIILTFFSALFALFIFLLGLYLVKYNKANVILSFAAVYFLRMLRQENESRLCRRVEKNWREIQPGNRKERQLL